MQRPSKDQKRRMYLFKKGKKHSNYFSTLNLAKKKFISLNAGVQNIAVRVHSFNRQNVFKLSLNKFSRLFLNFCKETAKSWLLLEYLKHIAYICSLNWIACILFSTAMVSIAVVAQCPFPTPTVHSVTTVEKLHFSIFRQRYIKL